MNEIGDADADGGWGRRCMIIERANMHCNPTFRRPGEMGPESQLRKKEAEETWKVRAEEAGAEL